MKKVLSSATFTIVLSFLGLFLLTTGISWAIFSNMSGTSGAISQGELSDKRSKIETLPKTEVCPINGEMFTDIEKDIWETRRPLAVVIENHADSRPQSGLSKADIVYEVVAEGGITRFLGIFYCGAAAEDVAIGPIRSARVYLISWAREYGDNPLFVHFGGANNICGNCPGGTKPVGQVDPKVRALEKLIDLGWRHSTGNALDGGANVSYPAIKRDQTRLGYESAWEHSAIGSTDLLFDLGIERGFGYKENGEPWTDTFRAWKFEDESPVSSPDAKTISFGFWDSMSDYSVKWEYDSVTNSYLRFNGGEPHTDWEFDKPQLSTKNIVIQFVDEEGPVDQEKHMFYETVDEGDAIFFMNGTVKEGTWEKKTEAGRTIFYDENGKEMTFVRGRVWVEAIPDGNDINY